MITARAREDNRLFRAVISCVLRGSLGRNSVTAGKRISWPKANDASVVHIQQLLGHAKLETTMRYLRVSIPQLKSTHAKYHPRERGGYGLG